MILIIEDNRRDANALKSMLRFAEYEADVVPDGEEALKILQEGLEPEAVITKLLLPGIDGFQVCRTIKQNTQLARIPVIIMTNLAAEPALDNLAKRAGAVELQYKPVQRDTLLEVVDRAILMAPVHRNPLAGQTATEEVAFLRDYNRWLSRNMYQTTKHLSDSQSMLGIRNAHVAAINALTTALGQNLDLDETVDTLLQKTAEMSGAQAVAIYEWQDDDSFCLQQVKGFGMPTPHIAEQFYAVEGSLITPIFRLNQALLFNAIDEIDTICDEFVIDMEPSSLIISPLVSQGNLSGLVLVMRTGGDPFDAENAETLFSLAGAAGLALRSAHLFQELDNTYRNLQDLDRRKSEFVAITSHELRTPIAIMMGYANLLQADEPNPQRKVQLAAIEKQANFLTGLVDALLNLHELQKGDQPVFLRCQPIQFDMMLKAAMNVAETLKNNPNNVQIQFRCDPLEINGDEVRLMLVFSNLIDNAVKFSPQNGVVRVLATAHPRGGGVVVSIEDQGSGIPEEEYQRIFEPFHQLEPSLTRKHGGMGLGLAIVKGVVELHGGLIHVRSKVGEGSRFVVELPFNPPPERCKSN